MTVESVTLISDLDQNNPAGGDSISEGDDHIRNIKRAIKNTFPNITDPVTATQDDLNKLSDFVKTGNGVFASLKHNGSSIMYGHNISSVMPSGSKRYRVSFNQPTDGFDNHYGVQVTPITTNGRPVIAMISDQRADWLEVDIWEYNGAAWTDPVGPVGFYMTMVDMIQTEANANT
jgi:hypothetical protein